MAAVFLFSIYASLCAASEQDPFSSKAFCDTGVIRICGEEWRLPPAQLGDVLTRTRGPQYETPQLTAQCVSGGGHFYFRLLGDAASFCELRKCEGGSVKLCGRTIAVKESVSIGRTTIVDLPADMLADTTSDPSGIVARCVLDDDAPRYEVADTKGFSCNAMACLPARLPVCGSYVEISVAGSLGQALSLVTPAGQKVVVQCLASGGRAPAYTVSEYQCE